MPVNSTSQTSRKGRRQKLVNSTSNNIAVSASDVKGSIFCKDIARMLLNLPVEFNFPRLGSFTGTVTNFDSCEDFGGAILHEVTFSDGDKQDYSYEEILQGHENFQMSHCPNPLFETVLPSAAGAVFSPLNILSPRPAPPHRTLDLPISFRTYPVRLAFESTTVQGQFVERRVTPAGVHEWRVQLPEPFQNREHWIDNEDVHKLFHSNKKKNKIGAPSKITPTLNALKGFTGPFFPDSNWTVKHELVGTTVNVFLKYPLSAADGEAAPSRKSNQKKRLSLVTIEAAYIPNPGEISCGAAVQFWGRVHDDLSTSVVFLSEALVVEAMYSRDSITFSPNKLRPRRPFRHTATSITERPSDSLPDVSPCNETFLRSVASLKSRLPLDPITFYENGFLLTSRSVPRSSIPLYRRCLGQVAKGFAANPDDENFGLLFLIFDALILAPFDVVSTFAAV